MEQKQKLVAALPKQLIIEVENLQLSKTYKDKLIDFILLLFKKSNKKHGDFTSPVPLPYHFLNKRYGNNYNREWAQLAVDSKIIHRNESYTVGTEKKKGKPKTYNVNPFYLETENFDFKNVTYTAKVLKTESKAQTQIEKWVSKDMESLKFDFKLYRTMTSNYVNSISFNELKLKVDNEIKFDTERAFFINKKKAEKENLNTKYVVSNSQEKNLSVIKTKKGYVIDNIDRFIQEKKNTTYMSYMSALNKLEYEPYYASRNTTNNRLDNNLTNLSKKLTRQILQDNALIEIDMNNCQFAIVGNILPKDIIGEKVKLFKDIVASGKLYERMMKLLNINDRDEVKDLMFQINFGNNPKKPTENYKKICAEFPEVMKWIWDFKEKNGYKSFSVMLQNKESQMFIDNMYFHIKSKMKKFCLTKHDSIICKKEDEEEIRKYMCEYFDSINFNCSINYKPVTTPVQTNIDYTYTSTTQSNMVAYTMSEISLIKPLETLKNVPIYTRVSKEIVPENEEKSSIETIDLILNMQQDLFVSYMLNFDDKPINKEIKKKFFSNDLIHFERCDYSNKKEWLKEKFNQYHNK